MSITDTQATQIAETLQAQMGEAAVAAAVLKAQLAAASGDPARTGDWQAIAEKLAPAP